MSTTSFTSQGYRLAGNLFIAQETKQLAFLLIQGWTGHQNIEAAQALAKLGFTSMTYDMRGNGDSEGNLAEFSRADFIKDALTAYDHLKHQANPEAIGVIGSSFGSYTAVMVSTQRPVSCLSLRVPASYRDEDYAQPQLARITSAELTAWRDQPLDYIHNRAFSALHDFAGNIQIVEADHDELVPHQACCYTTHHID
jgi:pimeloyl-ACP methyl ester carboxylesterase